MNDLKFAFRQLLKNPGFTAVAVLTLALGIGANTAIFSAVNALWLRALPSPGSDRLVLAWGKKPQQGRDKIPFSWPNFADLRAQGRSFENLGAWALGRANLTGGDDNPEQVQQAIVSAGFFATMGVTPILGRSFLPGEDERGGEKVVVLSHSLWQRRFGADANLVGRSITLDGQGYRVLGVMPASFRFLSFPRDTEIWIPIGLDPFTDRRFARAVNSLGVIGRLKPGLSLAQAQAETEGGDGRHCASARGAISGEHRMGHHPRRAEGTGRRQLPARFARVGCGRGIRAHHRWRERGEPAAGAGQRAAT